MKKAKIDEAEKLADLHIRLCPVTEEKHRKGLITKCLQLLNHYSPEQIRTVIEDCSRRARQGDGWGVVLKCMPFADDKLREQAFNENLMKERKKYPKRPVRRRSQPEEGYQEERTRQECNRQVRALLAEKN